MSIEYNQLKEKLTHLFDVDKLAACKSEWGFYNERDKEIRCIGYATNITPEVIGFAHGANIDFLLTHHDSWTFVYGLKEKCNQLLDKYDITHGFFHAPLDDANFGTASSLAKALNITDCRKVMPYADVYFAGVIGETDPVSFEAFADQCDFALDEPVRRLKNNDRLVNNVCVATGAGNMTNEMRIAAEAGCDTYITGEYVLYSQQYARLAQMNLIVGSHTGTEVLGVKSMAQLAAADTDIRIVRIEEARD